MQILVLITVSCYTDFACLQHIGSREGVRKMEPLVINFILAVAANVLANRICKWLDGQRKGK